MKQGQKFFVLYSSAIVGALILLVLVAEWGYKLKAYFPNTSLRSPEVMTLLFTVVLIVANISLVMITGRYTEIAAESIELSKAQELERQSIKFKHGLQISPINASLQTAKYAEIWIANLGARSFLVKKAGVIRHDMLGVQNAPQFAQVPNEFQWNEVVQPGEKKALPVPDLFWLNVNFGAVDVEVWVTVSDEKGIVGKVTEGLFVACNYGVPPIKPYQVKEGFNAPWFPVCPKCGKQDGMFSPVGLESFHEVREQFERSILEDYTSSCPNHSFSKIS